MSTTAFDDPPSPVRFSVDHPDRRLNSTTTALRAVVAIPVVTVLAVISGGIWPWSEDRSTTTVAVAGGMLFLGPLLMIVCRRTYPRRWFGRIVAWFAILFTGRYPRSIFELVAGVMGWNNRVIGHACTLVTDRYPPFRLT